MINSIVAQKPLKGTLLASALWYYRNMGWNVLPLYSIVDGVCTCAAGASCITPGKHPCISWTRYQQEKVTEQDIMKWWRRWPTPGVGIITGSISGIIVLDIDGPQGAQTMKDNNFSCPLTPVSKTGGGGWHYVFKHPGFECRNFASRSGETLLPKVDFRGDGGIIVAPPTLHKSGQTYQWVDFCDPQDALIADAPDWLIELIRNQPQTGTKTDSATWKHLTHNAVTKGQRNDTITRLAGHLLRRYVDPYIAVNLLLAFNQIQCSPPLEEKEIISTLDSIARKERMRRGKTL